MAEISKVGIERAFARMRDAGDTTEYTNIIDIAYNNICSITEGRELTSAEAIKCQYAAAADAAYAYTLERASREELMFTEHGGVRARLADADAIALAKKLRDHAFSQLVGIVSADDIKGIYPFTFRTIEG